MNLEIDRPQQEILDDAVREVERQGGIVVKTLCPQETGWVVIVWSRDSEGVTRKITIDRRSPESLEEQVRMAQG